MFKNISKTIFYNKNVSKFYLIDCKNKKIGRLSTLVVDIITGKYNIFYTPNIINNNRVILYNVDKMSVLNKKKKKYIHYTGYPGGQKIIFFKEYFLKYPKKILLHSILGMIKKNHNKNYIKKKIFLYTSKEKFSLKNSYITITI
ncbi:MAG: uL13 family ribosomal protein [Candidatus Shikimatogenerans sp. Tduv]|uniref:50S ribosomal protein L13 n=1 Tax=Candidatus Shikimatogenerans sp. Tduv TaxID=3158567 RepID=A0AAU7QRN8_9FLAO